MQIWHVLIELGQVQKSPTKLICDNQSAIHLACNLVYLSKEQHIDLDTHYIQNLVLNGVIYLEHYPMEHEDTNIFTRSKTKVNFVYL